ncbi:MAG: MFS transporter, partial [Bdellovibrionota bacterium]
GFIATGLALFGIREVAAKTPASQKVSHAPIGSTFKRYLVVVAIFSLANSSDAFILLRAKELGYTLPGILGMIGLLNLVSSLTSVPAAALSDRLGRRTLIAMGWGIYALTYALFGSQLVATSRFAFAGGVAIYGLFFGFTESVERAWIADLAPAQARGRAYGLFGLIAGASALPASAIFGWAWDRFGSAVPFYSCAAIALFASGLLFLLFPARPLQHPRV